LKTETSLKNWALWSQIKKIETNYVNHILIRDPVKVESRETVQIIAPPYL